MKIKRFSFLVGISLATALTLSCSDANGVFGGWLKDLTKDLNFASLTGSNLLQNSRLGFATTEDGIPDGDVTVITDVQIEGSAISGGTTQITITSIQELAELYLQLSGENGFYRWVIDDSKDRISANPYAYVYQIVLEFNENLQGGDPNNPRKIEFTVSGKTKTGDVVESKTEELKTVSATRGAFQISLSWDVNDDIDLHVYTPAPNNDHLYFANRRSGKNDNRGELDIDSNAGCGIDSIRVENIFLQNPLIDGDYRVEVDEWSKCSAGSSGRSTGARYRVTANVGGRFVNFSDKQTGQFTSGNGRIVVGTIKIRNGQFQP